MDVAFLLFLHYCVLVYADFRMEIAEYEKKRKRTEPKRGKGEKSCKE